jgi:hypothetical protein
MKFEQDGMKKKEDGKRSLQDLKRWYKNYDNNNTLAILLRAEKWLTITNTTANKNMIAVRKTTLWR